MVVAEREQIPWALGVDRDDLTAELLDAFRKTRGFYLVDRKGNLRMASLFAGDLERAIESLLNEQSPD